MPSIRSVEILVKHCAHLLIVASCLRAASPLLYAAMPHANRLSTSAVASRIEAERQAARRSPGTQGARTQLAAMHREIESFLTRQIDTYPSISPCELENQLASALSLDGKGCREWEQDDAYAAPRVFATGWKPAATRLTFAITYLLDISAGPDGSETVLESYTWEKGQGVHRTAALVPQELRGVVTSASKVCWFPDPDRYWVLVAGDNEGASGLVQSGTASLFEIGINAISTIWHAPPGIGNVASYAMPASLRWEIGYVMSAEAYANRPSPPTSTSSKSTT